MVNFYFDQMVNGYSLSDADGYAWFSTLFGYDIGQDNAMSIIRFLYEGYYLSVMEISTNSRRLLERICSENAVDVSFDSFVTFEPKAINYGWYKS